MITQTSSFVIILFSPPKSFEVPLQAPIALHCEATAFPEPEITWYLPSGKSHRPSIQSIFEQGAIIPMGRGNGRINVANNGTLEISTLEDVDYGTYTCTARNIGGETSLKITLNPSII